MRTTWMIAASIMALSAGCNDGERSQPGATAPASSAKAADDPCAGTPAVTFRHADIAFQWTEAPSLDSAPKDKAYAFVGAGRPFEIAKFEIWVSEGSGTWSLRSDDEVSLGPGLTFPGVPKAGLIIEDKFGKNQGHFQIPKKGETVRCAAESTSFNGKNARVLEITRYDEKTADGRFVTTWAEHYGANRKFWAAGTFKNAKVRLFKK